MEKVPNQIDAVISAVQSVMKINLDGQPDFARIKAAVSGTKSVLTEISKVIGDDKLTNVLNIETNKVQNAIPDLSSLITSMYTSLGNLSTAYKKDKNNEKLIFDTESGKVVGYDDVNIGNLKSLTNSIKNITDPLKKISIPAITGAIDEKSLTVFENQITNAFSALSSLTGKYKEQIGKYPITVTDTSSGTAGDDGVKSNNVRTIEFNGVSNIMLKDLGTIVKDMFNAVKKISVTEATLFETKTTEDHEKNLTNSFTALNALVTAYKTGKGNHTFGSVGDTNVLTYDGLSKFNFKNVIDVTKQITGVLKKPGYVTVEEDDKLKDTWYEDFEKNFTYSITGLNTLITAYKTGKGNHTFGSVGDTNVLTYDSISKFDFKKVIDVTKQITGVLKKPGIPDIEQLLAANWSDGFINNFKYIVGDDKHGLKGLNSIYKSEILDAGLKPELYTQEGAKEGAKAELKFGNISKAIIKNVVTLMTSIIGNLKSIDVSGSALKQEDINKYVDSFGFVAEGIVSINTKYTEKILNANCIDFSKDASGVGLHKKKINGLIGLYTGIADGINKLLAVEFKSDDLLKAITNISDGFEFVCLGIMDLNSTFNDNISDIMSVPATDMDPTAVADPNKTPAKPKSKWDLIKGSVSGYIALVKSIATISEIEIKQDPIIQNIEATDAIFAKLAKSVKSFDMENDPKKIAPIVSDFISAIDKMSEAKPVNMKNVKMSINQISKALTYIVNKLVQAKLQTDNMNVEDVKLIAENISSYINNIFGVLEKSEKIKFKDVFVHLYFLKLAFKKIIVMYEYFVNKINELPEYDSKRISSIDSSIKSILSILENLKVISKYMVFLSILSPMIKLFTGVFSLITFIFDKFNKMDVTDSTTTKITNAFNAYDKILSLCKLILESVKYLARLIIVHKIINSGLRILSESINLLITSINNLDIAKGSNRKIRVSIAMIEDMIIAVKSLLVFGLWSILLIMFQKIIKSGIRVLFKILTIISTRINTLMGMDKNSERKVRIIVKVVKSLITIAKSLIILGIVCIPLIMMQKLIILGVRVMAKVVNVICHIVTSMSGVGRKTRKKLKQIEYVIKTVIHIVIALILLAPILMIFALVSPALLVGFLILGVVLWILTKMIRMILRKSLILALSKLTIILSWILVIGLLLMGIALIGTVIVNKLGDLILFFVGLAIVIGIVALIGLAMKFLSPILLAAVIGFALVAIVIGLIFLIAVMLMGITKIELDTEAVIGAVKNVMECVRGVIMALFEAFTLPTNEEDGVFTKIIKGFLGTGAALVELILAVPTLVLTFIAVFAIMMITLELMLIEKMAMKMDSKKIIDMVKQVVQTAYAIIDIIMDASEPDSLKAKNHESDQGVWASVFNWIGGVFGRLGTIVNLILSIASLALTIVAIACVLILYGEMNILAQLDPQSVVEKANQNVLAIMLSASYIMNTIFDPTESDSAYSKNKPSDQGFWSGLFGYIGDAFGKLGEIFNAILSVASLALSIIAIGLVLLLHLELSYLADHVDTNKMAKAKKSAAAVVKAGFEVMNAIFCSIDAANEESNEGWIEKLLKWVLPSKLLFIIKAIMAIGALALTLLAIFLIGKIAEVLETVNTAADGPGVKYASYNTNKVLNATKDVVTSVLNFSPMSLNKKNIQKIRSVYKQLEQTEEILDELTDTIAHINKFSQGKVPNEQEVKARINSILSVQGTIEKSNIVSMSPEARDKIFAAMDCLMAVSSKLTEAIKKIRYFYKESMPTSEQLNAKIDSMLAFVDKIENTSTEIDLKSVGDNTERIIEVFNVIAEKFNESNITSINKRKFEIINNTITSISSTTDEMLIAISRIQRLWKAWIPDSEQVLEKVNRVLGLADIFNDSNIKLITFERELQLKTTLVSISNISDAVVSTINHVVSLWKRWTPDPEQIREKMQDIFEIANILNTTDKSVLYYRESQEMEKTLDVVSRVSDSVEETINHVVSLWKRWTPDPEQIRTKIENIFAVANILNTTDKSVLYYRESQEMEKTLDVVSKVSDSVLETINHVVALWKRWTPSPEQVQTKIENIFAVASVFDTTKVESISFFQKRSIRRSLEGMNETIADMITSINYIQTFVKRWMPEKEQLQKRVDSVFTIVEMAGNMKIDTNKFNSNVSSLLKISRVFKSFELSGRTVENTKRIAENTIKVLDKVNGTDIEKLKTAERVFKNMAEFSKSISGNFDKLADSLNEKIAPLMEELKKVMEDVPNHIKTSTTAITKSVDNAAKASNNTLTRKDVEEQVRTENPKLNDSGVKTETDKRMAKQRKSATSLSDIYNLMSETGVKVKTK